MELQKSQLVEITKHYGGDHEKVLRLLMINGFIALEGNKKAPIYSLIEQGRSLVALMNKTLETSILEL